MTSPDTTTARPSGTPAAGCVVVGCDGRRTSRDVVLAGAGEAASRGVALMVLRVVPSTTDDQLSVPAQRRDREQRWRRAVAETAEVADEARAAYAGLAVGAHVVDGDDRASLASALRECRLLVIGDRGRSGHRAFLMGSLSRELLKAADCPVLVLKDAGADGAAGTGQVVVGLAGAGDDVAVLRAAADEAMRLRARLVVVHSGPDGDRAEQHVHAAVAQARLDPELPMYVTVSTDHPAAALLRQGADAALVVVGTRGPLALARLAADSVSRQVVDDSKAPVLLVPRARTAVG